jgi:hypothetical protein
MNLPPYMPEAHRRPNESRLGWLPRDGLMPQDWFDPRNIACASACAGKAGFAACLARCVIDGLACDGGIDNCTAI